MSKRMLTVLSIAFMVVIIVVLDITVFRHRFGARLTFNIGVVLLFIGFYLRFIRPSRLQ